MKVEHGRTCMLNNGGRAWDASFCVNYRCLCSGDRVV